MRDGEGAELFSGAFMLGMKFFLVVKTQARIFFRSKIKIMTVESICSIFFPMTPLARLFFFFSSFSCAGIVLEMFHPTRTPPSKL